TLMTRGNTATAFARASRSRGIALSGTCMIASNALAARDDCSAASLIFFSRVSSVRAAGVRPAVNSMTPSAPDMRTSFDVVVFITVLLALGVRWRKLLDGEREHQQRPSVEDEIDADSEADEPRARRRIGRGEHRAERDRDQPRGDAPAPARVLQHG